MRNNSENNSGVHNHAQLQTEPVSAARFIVGRMPPRHLDSTSKESRCHVVEKGTGVQGESSTLQHVNRPRPHRKLSDRVIR